MSEKERRSLLPEVQALLDKADGYLKVCGSCDAGVPGACTCVAGDPRSVISDLVKVLSIYLTAIGKVQPLSTLDRNLRHAEVDIEMAGDTGCGGTWSWSGPPCGGCVDCYHGMISHGFEQERAEANVYQNAGFEWAPRAINAYEITKAFDAGFAPRHPIDHLGNYPGCDKPKEER